MDTCKFYPSQRVWLMTLALLAPSFACAASPGADAQSSFKAMDANGDGKLTLDEFKAGAPKGFGHHGRRGHHKSHGAAVNKSVK